VRLPIDLSVSDLAQLCRELGISQAQQSRLRLLLASADPKVQGVVLDTLRGRLDPRQLDKLIYVEPEPPMDEFLYGKRYLNLPHGSVFPRIVDLLVEIDKPDITQAWICGGKGLGKSSLVSIIMAKGAWHLTRRLRDPSAFFRLLPGEKIGLVNMSVSAIQANDVVFGKLLTLLDNSGCFIVNGNSIYNATKTRIEFTKNVHVLSGHSNYRAYFGYNVFRGVIDEMSWFTDTEENPVGEEVFQGMLAAASTRFGEAYKIVCVSTPQSKDDPLYSRVEKGLLNGVPIVKGEVDGDSYAKVTS
jgi:hypothetical protein